MIIEESPRYSEKVHRIEDHDSSEEEEEEEEESSVEEVKTHIEMYQSMWSELSESEINAAIFTWREGQKYAKTAFSYNYDT